MLSDEKIKLNFVTYTKKLQRYNCYSQAMIDEIGDKIMICPFSMSEDSGSCYRGSMIDVVINHLCLIGYNLNATLFPDNSKFNVVKVNSEMLMRVLLLQHISKAEMFVPTNEAWKIKKGVLYDFNDKLSTTLKLGERSLYLCQKYGIDLCEEEYEAMKVLDLRNDERGSFYMNPLPLIVNFSNQIVTCELRKKYKESHKEIMEV